jgi:hypothetical protein
MSTLVAQVNFNGHIYSPPQQKKLSHLFKLLFSLYLCLVLCMYDDMLKTTYLCMSLSGYLPAKLHYANYSLGMNQFRRLLPRGFVNQLLEAHNGFALRRHHARHVVYYFRHAEQSE